MPWMCQGGDGAPSTQKPALCFPVPVLLCEEATEAGRRALGSVCACDEQGLGLVSTALGCGSEHFFPSGQLLTPSQALL